MEQRERMEKGLIYDPLADDILSEQMKLLQLLYDYNATRPSEQEKRTKLLEKMFGAIGEGCYIEPPFHANFAGRNVFMGKKVYANFNLTLVDDGNIYIGDNVMFGPNVTLTTAAHPITAELRRRGLQFNKDIHIGGNVWIGANAVILPGVTVGENSVIGAGSVVTKDIPPDVVAVGVPCRVLRSIGSRDREYFFKNERIDWENIQGDHF